MTLIMVGVGILAASLLSYVAYRISGMRERRQQRMQRSGTAPVASRSAAASSQQVSSLNACPVANLKTYRIAR